MKTKVLKKLCSFLLVLSMLTSTGIGQAVGELVGTNLTVSAADTLTSSKYPFMKNIPVSPESDFYFYDYYDGGVIIMGYAGNSSEIHIPDAIDGKSVLAISRECFEENEKITHLILPDSLLYAENESFYHCTNLKEIYLGSLQSGLDWHGIEWLLDGCENLQVLSMSDNANFSFAYANNAEYSGQGDPLFHRKTADSLKKIYIGSSMENVPVELFYGNNLEWVEVGKNNKLYSNDKGVVYSADKKTLMVCGTSYPDSEYIIPNGTQAIYRYAFQDCKNIKRLTIPDSVTKISAPFSGCDDLTICGSQGSYAETYAKNNNIPFKDVVSDYEYTVNSDNTVTITKYIGSDTKAVIPSSINGKKVTSIGDNAFYQCSVLTSITIPNSITSIGTEAFYDCKKLTDITIPNGVTSIGVWAFLNCFGLTNITIPDSVTFIGDYAFENCTNLTSINVDTGNKAYSSQNGILFNKNKTAILSFPCAKKGAYVIPDSVTSIGNGAFEYGAGLTSITIPDSVTSIGMGAFLGCTGLTGITIPNSVTVIENWTFRKCSGLKSMTIPDSVTSIGSWAFEYCSGLTSIIIPNSVTSIGLLAFLGCYNLTIYGNSNSYAAAYAAENYIPFTAIEPTPEPKYISDMTITLTPTSFTYDGTAKKPTVTVEEEIEYLVYEIPPPTSSGTVASATLIIRTETEIKKLVEGTDYSLKYENNINAGTAKVTITGMNGYNSSVTKDFTINPKSVANAAITLNPTEYICDGTEKEPTVTVKDNQKMLVSGTDYSVSYSDNVNVGTATVIVTGKKNYTGTAKTTFLIKESSLQFQWGVDNWKFENSDDYILNVPYSEKINSTYLNVLKKNLSYSEYMKIFWGEGRSPALLYTTNGSCYGMSALAFLAKYGFMNFGSYQTNAEKLYDLDAPIKHSLNYLSNKNNVSSLITYYQMLQVKDVIQQKCRKVSNRSNKTNIQEILALLDKNAVVLVGYQWGTEKNSFAHAILAYGYEYAKNSFNGVTYDGYIKIYDPNCSYNDTGVYIYFNKSTYHWIIPGKNLSSSGYPSVKFSCIDADTDDINDGGYLGGNTNNSDSDKFIARIDAPVISKERFVSKITQSGGTYMNNDDGKNDIIEDYSYILNGNSNGIFGYNLYDPDSAYEVSQKTAADLELHMDYENCDLYGYSSLGKSVIFDKKGFVSIEGETGDYEMAMTFDCDYPTDWFYINVSGTGASDISLLKEKNGYVLSGDHLKKIQICTKNMTDSASIGFSTDYKKVFIYEIDKNTIGLKVDKDNNGTYETSIKGVPILENNSYLSSDSIQLGSTVTVIASGKGGKGSLQYAVYYKKTFESKWTVAQDYNTNTTVSITPAKVTDYDICVKVKDKNGSIEKKYFVVSVYDVLKNTSTVSAMQINLSSTVSVKCSATGGTGNYTYAVYYKQKSQNKWTLKQDFGKNAVVSVKPENAVDYDICVKVKDTNGNIEKKYFAVKIFDILKNTSTISATQINLGSTVSVKASATGGTENYTYAVYYKQQSQSKWTVKQDFSKNTSVSIKPENAVDYDICAKVKDSNGNVEKKYFVVKVFDILKNTSTISATQINLGSSISVKASATGGAGNYTYSVLYKQSSQLKWTLKQDFSKNATISVSPGKAVDYDICVKVKDSDGNIEKKYFAVKVLDILKNTSTISATQINLGSAVSVKCSATGGMENYTYSVLYKQSSQSKWTLKQDFSKNATISVKPEKAVDYDICVKVKDTNGNIEKKYFTVKVLDILKNTSTISAKIQLFPSSPEMPLTMISA